MGNAASRSIELIVLFVGHTCNNMYRRCSRIVVTMAGRDHSTNHGVLNYTNARLHQFNLDVGHGALTRAWRK
eukprot:10678108-Lingulodinium_polyedra.AAC.1